MAENETVVTTISKISDRVVTRNAALVVIYGADLGRKYDLDRATTIIGRSSKSDLQIDQDSISRAHAKIVLDGAAATISDMGSTNGTAVNDETIGGPTPLRNGDFIKLGRTIFKYIAGGNIESQYHEEIYRLTTVDGLTQIFNKRYFLEILEREVSRCHRYRRPLALAMIDIDHFKKVNDTHGHLAGDHVLKMLAAAVKSRIRRDDVFARYGGEEFALILPEVDIPGARTMAEKVRAVVEAQQIVFDGQIIPVTISIGVAACGGEPDAMQALIKASDDKLYEAKQGGRNKVCG